MGPQQVGRALAGLIGYSPSPGIYSRLERAVEAMRKNIIQKGIGASVLTPLIADEEE